MCNQSFIINDILITEDGQNKYRYLTDVRSYLHTERSASRLIDDVFLKFLYINQ